MIAIEHESDYEHDYDDEDDYDHEHEHEGGVVYNMPEWSRESARRAGTTA
jgi:ABC-type Zn2+ transport system substrate-binding protein/surface adhesin